MKIDALSTIITFSGLIFIILSLVIVFLGKKVGEKENGQQKIKVGKYIEVKGMGSSLRLTLVVN